MRKIRVSVVQYLNTAPLVRGFTHGPLRGKYELSFTVPSECAEALRAGRADVAIIPAVEFQRIPDLVVLPNLSIASKRTVESLLLVAKTPIRRVRSVALDCSSRSTQALTRILCARRWHIAPAFNQAAPDLARMLDFSDAALLIGDPALAFALAAKPQRSPLAPDGKSGTGSVVSDPAAAGVDLGAPVYLYDVVEEWRAMSGLPAVLALWCACPAIATPELVSDFQASRDFGLKQIPQIAEDASGELGLPQTALASYLTENIDFSLDPENLAGLRRYFREAGQLGIIDSEKDLRFAPSPAGALL
jgi:chorismate dehydratase